MEKTSEKINKKFGQKLRSIISKTGMSYGKAAEKIDVSLSFLNQLMNAESGPSLNMIYQIGEKLKIEPAELFQDDEAEEARKLKSDFILSIIANLPFLDEEQLRLMEGSTRTLAAKNRAISAVSSEE